MSEDSSLANQLSFSLEENLLPEENRGDFEDEWDRFVQDEQGYESLPHEPTAAPIEATEPEHAPAPKPSPKPVAKPTKKPVVKPAPQAKPEAKPDAPESAELDYDISSSESSDFSSSSSSISSSSSSSSSSDEGLDHRRNNIDGSFIPMTPQQPANVWRYTEEGNPLQNLLAIKENEYAHSEAEADFWKRKMLDMTDFQDFKNELNKSLQVGK
mmetsp:Transcript_12775/g.16360  ORF Transcript_12775/g.16360 Transcript_12775/m.16360 type:complete len:213 (+) Transcript_12775:1307-1945(+)